MTYTREELQALKETLKQRDGDKCYICNKSGLMYRADKGREFDLEHRDNNRFNYDLQNLGLSCHKCNIKKMYEYRTQHITQQNGTMNTGEKAQTEPKLLYMRDGGRGGGTPAEGGIEIRGSQLAESRMSPEMQKSERYYPVFESYIVNRVTEETESEYEDLLHCACRKGGIKIKAGGEWFRLVSCSDGPVKVVKKKDGTKWVVLREEPKESIGRVRT
jgi:hypothetical protein